MNNWQHSYKPISEIKKNALAQVESQVFVRVNSRNVRVLLSPSVRAVLQPSKSSVLCGVPFLAAFRRNYVATIIIPTITTSDMRLCLLGSTHVGDRKANS